MTRRCGFAAILGAPNAGKSTLVNALVGQKVSIVTHKVQTTRFRVRGVMIEGEAQIVLVDTPGVFKPKRRLDRAMVQAAWSGAEDADITVHIVDAEAEAHVIKGGGSKADQFSSLDAMLVSEGLSDAGRRAVLVLNKVDQADKAQLPAIVKQFWDKDCYDEAFMVSAKTGSGLAELRAHLAAAMPQGVWLYPEDQVGDLPLRLLASEITREKIYLRLHKEMPYISHVALGQWQEKKDGSLRIEQTILVERDSQRAIVLGHQGQTIKWIGKAAREEMTEAFERAVHLFLDVKVDPNWQRNKAAYESVGLDFDV